MNKLVTLIALAALSIPAHADEFGKQMNELLKTKSDSLVIVRVVNKLEFMGNEQEHRLELDGTVVDASGLIVVSNEAFDASGLGPQGANLKITPVDIKVVVGKDEKEYDAFFAAKDTDLGLAFLQIKEIGDLKLTPITFDKTAKRTIGDRVLVLSKLGKGFDYAPTVTYGRIIGKIKKPRKALLANVGGFNGSAIYAPTGELVGLFATLQSGVAEADPMTGGSNGRRVILSAKVVAAKVKAALKQAAEALAEEKEKAAEQK